jgi:sRNA-binding carbon storage regulator CsrA
MDAMLVLSRKPGEKIIVETAAIELEIPPCTEPQTIHIEPQKVVVTLVRSGPSACRLGVDAPPEFRIIRGELLATVQQAASAAA